MSGDLRRTPEGLASELAETRCAIPVLVTLLMRGGSASATALRGACADDVDDALQWLVAVQLIRPSDEFHIRDVDGLDAVFELTDIGKSLTASLTQLAELLQRSDGADRVPVGDR